MITPRPLRRNLPAALLFLAAPSLLALATPASAEDDTTPRLSTDGAHLSLTVRQPDATSDTDTNQAAGAADAISNTPGPSKPYGTAGTEWILVGGGAAYDFDDNTDVDITVGYSRFLADDVEWMLELASWYHAQEGEDAFSLNPAMEFRWHFYNKGKTSVFLNAGIGVLAATDNVPFDGSGFNFTPRAGIGMTHQIFDNGTRLVAGLRWHHISNARINGEDRNPSRDAPLLYLQLAIPF